MHNNGLVNNLVQLHLRKLHDANRVRWQEDDFFTQHQHPAPTPNKHVSDALDINEKHHTGTSTTLSKNKTQPTMNHRDRDEEQEPQHLQQAPRKTPTAAASHHLHHPGTDFEGPGRRPGQEKNVRRIALNKTSPANSPQGSGPDWLLSPTGTSNRPAVVLVVVVVVVEWTITLKEIVVGGAMTIATCPLENGDLPKCVFL